MATYRHRIIRTSFINSRAVPLLLAFSVGVLLTLVANKLEKLHPIEKELIIQLKERNIEPKHLKQFERPSCTKIFKQKINQCVLNRLAHSQATFWLDLNPAIRNCSLLLRETLKIEPLYNMDDVKYIVKPVHIADGSDSSQCVSLTLGIGNDIMAEKLLQKVFPKCQFIGVDPSYEAGKIFRKIGQFLNTAIGQHGQMEIEAPILQDNQSISNYALKNVSSVPFDHILSKIDQKIVDFLFADAEGAEYILLPDLTNRRLANKEICQISIELHGFDAKYHTTEAEFRAMFQDFLERSDFVPIMCGPDPPYFNRMFWMNFQSPGCVQKYLSNYC